MESPPTPPPQSNIPTPPNNSNNQIPINNNIPNNNTKQPNKLHYDPNAFRKNINIEPPQYKPALSPLKFKLIAGIVCTASFYLCCISEFGDHNDNNNSTVTSNFRRWHDRVLSNLLGFDVRAKIRAIEQSFFTIKDSAGNIVGDLSNIIKIGNTPNNINISNINNNNPTTVSNNNNIKEEKKEKENIFLKAATGSSTIKRTPISYNSQQDRIQQLLDENNKREKELELEVEKEIERHLKIRKEIQNNSNSSNNNSNTQ